MAIANSDGSILIGVKLATRSVEQGIQNIKNKFAELKKQKVTFEVLARSIKLSEDTLSEMNREYAELIALGGENTKRAIQLRETIKGTTQRISELRSAAVILGGKATKSFDGMSKGLKTLGIRIAGIVKSALIFSVLYRVMQGIVKLFKNILMSDEEFRQDWEELKAAFYTAAYPIINLIVPAIKFIVQQIRDWAVSIGKVAAALQGMSYSELVDQAKASKEAADNYADMEKSSKKTADNVKKQLAGFDDIQIISSGNGEEQETGQYAGFEGLGKYDTSGEKSMLDDLMTAIGGALVAVGLILLFHGQLAWGIGFIIAGAISGTFGVAIATLSDESVSQKVKDELSNVMLIVGVVAIVLGILLCMAQQWTFGIGLIAVGVASIVTPIALNWDGIKQQLQGDFGTWLAVGGIIAIVLGILLCCAQQWGLGIGLIALGAGAVVAPIAANWDAIKQAFADDKTAGWIAIGGTIAIVLGILLCFAQMWTWGIGLIALGAATVVTVVTVNWDSIKAILTDEKFAGWIAVVGLVAVILGILLCFVNLPLGIGLIALGATALVTVTALNWDAIVTNIKTFLFENSTLIALISGGLLILGIILCATGAGIPLGIALIVAGAAGLVTVTALNRNSIVEWVKNAWEAVKSFWNKYIAPVFTAKFWLDLAKKCGNGLIGGFESAINGIIGMFEKMINWIVDGLNKISFDVPSWVPLIGGKTFGFNIPKASFGRVSIPRLAQGAVIPPNREFLAVLGDQKQGTNIEAPLQTIVDAFNIALQGKANYGGGNTEVVLEIDGREFGRAVVEQGNRENRRIGTRLVIV